MGQCAPRPSAALRLRGCPQTSIWSMRHRAHRCVFFSGLSRRIRGHAQGQELCEPHGGPHVRPGGLTSPNEAVSLGPGGGPGGSPPRNRRQQGSQALTGAARRFRGKASSPVRRLRPGLTASRDSDARRLAHGAECAGRSDRMPSMGTDLGEQIRALRHLHGLGPGEKSGEPRR